MKSMKRLTLLGLLAVSAVAMLGAISVVALGVDEGAIFSTATTQTVFNGGIKTLHHGDVFHTPLNLGGNPVPFTQAIENFLPRLLGLDAFRDNPKAKRL